MHWTAQGIVPVVYNNCKRSLSHKHFKSLCCTPGTNIILYIKMYLSKNYCWMLCISRRVDGYPAETWPPCITLESILCCCCYCSGVSSQGEHDSRAPLSRGACRQLSSLEGVAWAPAGACSWEGPGSAQHGRVVQSPGHRGPSLCASPREWGLSQEKATHRDQLCVCHGSLEGGPPCCRETHQSSSIQAQLRRPVFADDSVTDKRESLQGSEDTSLGLRVHAIIRTCPFWLWAQRVGSWVSMEGWELQGGGTLLETVMPWGEVEWAQRGVGGPTQGDQHETGYLQRPGAPDGALSHSLWCPECQHCRLRTTSQRLRVWELVCSLRGHKDLWGRSVTQFRFHWPFSGHWPQGSKILTSDFKTSGSVPRVRLWSGVDVDVNMVLGGLKGCP